MPEVWVVRSADQPRARAMLREAGLMDSTRNAPDSFLSMGLRGTSAEAGRRDDMQRRAQRMKFGLLAVIVRSEEHTSELQSLMRISYAVFCLKKKKKKLINKKKNNTNDTKKNTRKHNNEQNIITTRHVQHTV